MTSLCATGAVYICTEDAFPNKRLHQLAESFAKRYHSLGLTARQLSDGIFVEHAATIVRKGRGKRQ